MYKITFAFFTVPILKRHEVIKFRYASKCFKFQVTRRFGRFPDSDRNVFYLMIVVACLLCEFSIVTTRLELNIGEGYCKGSNKKLLLFRGCP